MSDYVPTDTMVTAGCYVSREFGYGYSVRVVRSGFQNALFELLAGDGSRRLFLCDRYGNVELGPLDLEAKDDFQAWCMDAADSLYHRRNGFAVENAAASLEP